MKERRVGWRLERTIRESVGQSHGHRVCRCERQGEGERGEETCELHFPLGLV